MVFYIVFALLAGVAVGLGLRRAERVVANFRGMRVLTCPDNQQPAAVELACWRAALTGLLGKPLPSVRDCSRWPEQRDCDQACVKVIEGAPSATLVRTILSNWCRSNTCACCGAPLVKLRVGPHEPHLIDRQLHIFEWKEVPPERIPQTLVSCGPVCPNCVVAETHIW